MNTLFVFFGLGLVIGNRVVNLRDWTMSARNFVVLYILLFSLVLRPLPNEVEMN